MASSARRDVVGELALLLRAPEADTRNLGSFVAARAADLAPALGVHPEHLEALEATLDEVSAPRLRALLDRRRQDLAQADRDRRAERSVEAAGRLGAGTCWTDLGADLDVDLLLGELLADRTKKWISFAEPTIFTTIISRHLLAETAHLRRVHIDLAAWVDAHGLHFRWKGGRGGYNWRPREVDARAADLVLTVPLAPRAVLHVPERRRGGAWLGHILRQLGYL